MTRHRHPATANTEERVGTTRNARPIHGRPTLAAALLSAAMLLPVRCADTQDHPKPPQTAATTEEAPRPNPAADIPITATTDGFCTVLFSYAPRDSGMDGLHCIGSDGTGLKHLCSASVRSPARASPDGKRLTFESSSNHHGGHCQAVYDIERDSLSYLRRPRTRGYNLGWYPRWWDNDHIYYRTYRRIIKQNIHTGEHQPITREPIEDWLDPVWAPRLGRFVNLTESRICTFSMNGKVQNCDSLELEHHTEYPPILLKLGDKHLVAYETGLRFHIRPAGTPLPTESFVLADLQGNAVFRCSRYPLLQRSWSIVTCGPEGDWIYYIDEQDPMRAAIHLIHRHHRADTVNTQTLFVTGRGFLNTPSTIPGRIP